MPPLGWRQGDRPRIPTRHPDRRYQARGLCKNCYNNLRYHSDGGLTKQKMQSYKALHPEMRAASWRRHAYGLEEDQWRALYKEQRESCAICGHPDSIEKLNIDHNHATGDIHGLLCGHCNKALGHFKDSPALLYVAYKYLSLRNEEPVIEITRRNTKPRFVE